MGLTTVPSHVLEFKLVGSEESHVELILSNNNSEGRPVGWALSFDSNCPLKCNLDYGVIAANSAAHLCITYSPTPSHLSPSCRNISAPAMPDAAIVRWVDLPCSFPDLDAGTSALLRSASMSVHHLRLDISLRRVQLPTSLKNTPHSISRLSSSVPLAMDLRIPNTFHYPAKSSRHFMDQLANVHYYGALEAKRCSEVQARLDAFKRAYTYELTVSGLCGAVFCAVAYWVATHGLAMLILGVMWTTALLGTHLRASAVVQIVHLILSCLLLRNCCPSPWGMMLGLLLAAGTYIPLLRKLVIPTAGCQDHPRVKEQP